MSVVSFSYPTKGGLIIFSQKDDSQTRYDSTVNMFDFLLVLVHVDFKTFLNLNAVKKLYKNIFNLNMHSSYESTYGSSSYTEININ